MRNTLLKVDKCNLPPLPRRIASGRYTWKDVDAWMASLGIETDGADENGVTVIKQAFSADPLIQGQADCISTMTYNEYRQILQAGISEDELVTL